MRIIHTLLIVSGVTLTWLIPCVNAWSLNKILMTGPKASSLVENLTRNNSSRSKYKVYMLFVESIGRGAQRAEKECRFQFQWDRWNCEGVELTTQTVQSKADRETSFTQAVKSAGVMYDLTQQCNSGTNSVCSCDNSRNGAKGGYNWNWGGCSDNIRFGEMVTKRFLDSLITGKDSHAAMNLQNNIAGRKSVRRTTRLLCKCHGVSGSCTARTCWQQLASFRSVGFYLKRKYKRAVQVNYYDGHLRKGNDVRGHDFKMLKDKQLVFLEQSPNYCKENKTMGINGTLGRQCSRIKSATKQTMAEKKSCRTLCKTCGWRVRKMTLKVRTTCFCRFMWCCSVKCDSCEKTRKVYFCG